MGGTSGLVQPMNIVPEEGDPGSDNLSEAEILRSRK